MRGFVLSMVLFLGLQASANNLFIPNEYRNRRTVNLFSAIGWGDRKEVSLNYENSVTATKTSGIKDGEEKLNSYGVNAFYRLDNAVNLEFSGAKSDEKDTFVVAPSRTDKVDQLSFVGNVGYEFSQMPIALGFTYLNLQSDNKNGISDQTATTGYTAIGLGAGYRLPSEIYLGFGYFNTKLSITSTPDNIGHNYYVGAGKVYGDKKTPDGTTEAILHFINNNGTQSQDLMVQGLMNMAALQIYGKGTYTTLQGYGAGSGYGLKAGVDYQFMDFFVGPELEYTAAKTDSGSQADSFDTNLSVQAGYRTGMLEAYLGYGQFANKTEYDLIWANGNRDKSAIGAGLTYKF